MDKSKLLEEFVKLKRILKEHENKQAATPNNLIFNENKCCNQLQERNKSTIFFNPKKLNAVHNKSATKVTGKLSTHSSKVAKVFINPNFRKPDLLSSIRVPAKPTLNRDEELKRLRNHIDKGKIGSSQHGNNGFKKLPSDPLLSQQEVASNHGSRMSKLSVAESKPLQSNSRVIFVNPEFSSSSKLNARFFDSSSQFKRTKTTANGPECCDKNFNSDLKTHEQKLGVNMCRKRKIVMNGIKLTESSTSDLKRRKGTDNIVGSVNKIFVNPKFEEKESYSKNSKSSNIFGEISDMKVNCNLFSPSSSGIQTLNTRGTSVIPVLIGRKEVPNKFTSITYPLCSIVGPERGKQVAKKTISQRIRTRSTSLVTVSTTKLVRKRKLSQKIIETGGKVLPQPLFVSKTKLVRNVPKETANSSCIAKIKFKQLSQKTPAQYALAEKLHKSRRKSFTGNSLNLISLMPRPAVVTKIRSLNGKSLKLIRKSADIPSSSTVGVKAKTQHVVNARKMELRQQASRITMCLVQSRLKRNQFSKINVPVKVSPSPSCNKNIYKKNNVVSKKPLTKAALVGKKEAASVVAKTQARNTPLDMTKFIKSKYRLIRKQSSNTMSRYRLGQKIVNKITPHVKLVQRKKLKWKRKSNTSKRRLTRKDLSIKKIGGVFYRYSRTTLAKNKPSSKQVSQLQSKGIYQVASERRQNRFCPNKSPGRKQIGVSGAFFTTSASGMSWTRTNHCSARSILTQAKQKSIYLLSKKMKKNNEPCLFFHRHGRCSGHERGTCVRLHDRKYVAVCKMFVQGSCTDDKCPLNHSPSCHNMPTCHHFLAGQCGRDHCPYPHIKVSDGAPICLDFLKGHCQLGDQCAKRHFEICPSFEKGVCARGKYCPYPHPKNKMGESLKGKFKHIKRKPQPPREAESVSTPSLRYFEDVNLQKENQIHLKEDQKGNEDDYFEVEGEEVTCLKKRPQLGDLPSFIPLSHGFQVEDT